VAYDLDREHLTAFKIPNCWRERNPRARALPVVSIQFHPKDIGTLLIGYSEGAVVFSFKQNKPLNYFQYEIPRGAPGGDHDQAGSREPRRPRLTHAIWHPTGTFLLTAHEDSSLVFWDPRDGRAIEARTVQETSVNIPGKAAWGGPVEEVSLKRPYFHISWCSKENPDDTGLLIAGGTPTIEPNKGLTFFDLGHTPVYSTSSWDVLTQHFQNPKRVHILPTSPNAEVANLLLIPRSSPHYAGSHDPIAVLVLLSSGELVLLSFPSGHPITPTNQLHISLSFIHPFVTKTALTCIDRNRWLGMREVRQHGPDFLLGGAEQTKASKRHESRNIVQAAHADGTIRVWDAGHGDEIENEIVLQVDLARAVGRFDNVDVGQMSMSGATGELSVGLESGEVVIFRLNQNQNAGRPLQFPAPNEGPGKMTNITNRADPGLKEGLLPLTMTNDQQGPVTALKHSDVGFVVAGYQSGGLCVIDMRGPAIIYTVSLADLTHHRGASIKGSRLRPHSNPHGTKEWPTVIEFGVMTLEGEGMSSCQHSVFH
jgi:syntaxin-binding protein 5